MFDLLESIGGCVLYHDYRSGSFRDWSGNGNHGTPTNANLDRDGCNFPTQTSNVAVSYSASLNIGAAGAASFLCLLPQEYESRSTAQQRIFDANSVFSSYFDAAGDTFYFLVAGTQKSALIPNDDLNKSRGFGLSWTDGNIPDLYLNGVYGYQIGTALSTGTTDQDLYIGNRASDDRSLMQKMSALVIFNKALTATEHAQVYAALQAMRWPTKVIGRGFGQVAVDPNEAGLVGAWDLVPVAGKVFDLSGNGNDGQPSYGGVSGNTLSIVSSVLGKGADFNGVTSAVNCGTSDSLNFGASTDLSLSVWFRTFGSASRRFCQKGSSGSASYKAGLDGSHKPYIELQDGTDTFTMTAAAAVNDGRLHHAVFVVDRDTQDGCKVYLDGLDDTNTKVGTITDIDSVTNASDLRIGSYGGSTYFIGEMFQAQLFNVAKDSTWVAAEYAKGAKALTRTAWGARETSANVTSGNITNTPFEVVSGTWSIGTEAVGGKQCKVLNCVADGVVAISTGLFRSGNLGAARGTFEFWYYKGATANAPYINFIGSQATGPGAAGFDGYSIRLPNANEIALRRFTNGSGLTKFETVASYITAAAWQRYTVTVANGGVFTVYYNGVIVDPSGGSGTNPVTDVTHLESKYITVDGDAGDKLALGAIDGSYSLTKYLGVV